MARGWARLKVAAAVSAASTSSTENAGKLAVVEAYTVDLQQQVQSSLGGRQVGARVIHTETNTKATEVVLQTEWTLQRALPGYKRKRYSIC